MFVDIIKGYKVCFVFDFIQTHLTMEILHVELQQEAVYLAAIIGNYIVVQGKITLSILEWWGDKIV